MGALPYRQLAKAYRVTLGDAWKWTVLWPREGTFPRPRDTQTEAS